MRMFGIIIAFLAVLGSFMPQSVLAHRHSGAMAAISMTHMAQPFSPIKECTGCAGTCVGCAAPVQMVEAFPMPPIAPDPLRLPFMPTALAAFVTPLELPPPRLKA